MAKYDQFAAVNLTGTSWTDIYTVPEGKVLHFNIGIINIGEAESLVSVAFSNTEGEPATADIDLVDVSVKAKKNEYGKNGILSAGYTIKAKSTASSVNIRLSGRLSDQED